MVIFHSYVSLPEGIYSGTMGISIMGQYSNGRYIGCYNGTISYYIYLSLVLFPYIPIYIYICPYIPIYIYIPIYSHIFSHRMAVPALHPIRNGNIYNGNVMGT